MKNILFDSSRFSLPALFLLLLLVAPAASTFAFDDFGNACDDALTVPASGWIDGYLETREDRDVFRIDVAEGGLLAVEVAPLGRQAGQPRLALLDGGCRRTAASAAARQVARAGAPAIYFIEVSGGGDGELAYRLQSGFAAESRPTDLWLLSPDGGSRAPWTEARAAVPAIRGGSKLKELEEDVDEVEPITAPFPSPDKDCDDEECVEEDVDEVEPLLPVIHLRLAAAAAPPGGADLAGKDCEEEECVEEDVDEVEPIVVHLPSPDKDCEEEECVEEDVDEVEPLLPDLEIDLLAPPVLARDKDGCGDDCPEEDVDEVEPLVADGPGVLAVQLVHGGGKRAASQRGYVTLRAGAWRVASELRAGEASPRVWARLYRVCPQLLGDDHGESFGCSTAVTLGEQLAGEIRHGAIDDRDAFAFDLGERRTVLLETDGHVDTSGALYDARGALVAADDDGGDGVGFRLEVTLEPGRYYLRIAGVGGEEGAYTLTTADLTAAR